MAEMPRHEITQQVLEHGVLDVHRRMFGLAVSFVLFSMLGMGPAGAVLYRCADFVRTHWEQRRKQAGFRGGTQALQAAHKAWQWINWLPARVTAACFATVGNFELAVDNWRQAAEAGPDGTHSQSETILLAVAAGAIDVAGDFGARAPVPAVNEQQASGTQDPTLAENAALSYGVSLHPRTPSGMPRLHMLARLIWRSVLLWALLIALVTVTHWVS